ncbi:5-formyltetrahydrofolate cyclo-ligase [Varunaivibrio sulfuroxidans]|uniref:5-formyltetrahydrofolate cyclo-ligase n=1 Tax=Varunaivibrio sulfuroxidans TaxID=1773489 RepID=A0A4R3JBQ3_9PROT|nr:5-formyltetrahydrofolate cyclo-ligase [Varunaivibrio sulfuroxidans]TCS63142.1 5-formyltetrahydrofolate cyclo-ligase [Varunaivibrio sulfuroxidans]WES31791.1 5-formyltetrahydrofolate cyclo-ligase [Varunaivibrio sulfuroxidans]
MTLGDASPSPLDAAKTLLRAQARARREEIAPDARARASRRLCARFLAMMADGVIPLRTGESIGGYWPMGAEVDLRSLYERLAKRGHFLALARVRTRDAPLEFRRWRPGDPLETGVYGTSHPLDGAPLVFPRLVLAPLLAFDRLGGRLGYGGGYYDRTLEKDRKTGDITAVGVAFSAQEVARVPVDRRDQPLDWIVTEKEAIQKP